MSFLNLCVFYSFLFALVRFRKDSIWAWVKSIGLFLLSFGLILFLNHLRAKLASHYGIALHESFGALVSDTIYTYTALAFYALGYYYLTRYGTKQKELRALEQQQAAKDIANAQLRQELLEVENNFLRAQINPHFLYNTLNLFYARALPVNKELANGLLTLADIMRYSLEATENGQLVPLPMEVAQLKRVMVIHQLRFSNRLNISFTEEGDNGNICMAPLILITLLENALKHGELNEPDAPVTAALVTDATHLYFTIRNKKTNQPPEHSHGIGLHNIKKRLGNIYGTHYRLAIEDADGWYKAALVIEHNPAGGKKIE